MGISLREVTERLLSGKRLAWERYKDYRAGSITLDQPEQRRLLEFLLAADSDKVSNGDETLFTGLVAAWENEAHDPAKVKAEVSESSTKQSWRLERIEAYGFGGLTIFGGKPFDLYIGGKNWCLEGQNGSGKTSLVSSILWALTGKRIREHEGPIEERGERENVESDDGTKIGSWPPLAAYPTTVTDLAKQAEVWVRLTFRSANGDTTTAYRRMVSSPVGVTQVEEKIDPRLTAAHRLAEIGILMPARLTKIGFGKNSLTLYEAVKQLTGLDQLSDIADGCTAFGASNRKFMKYAKDNGIELHERKFTDSITNAKQLAEEFDFKLPELIHVYATGTDAALSASAKLASDEAGKHLEVLKSDISPEIDTNTSEGRATIKTAVSAARGLVTQGPKAITLFQVWKALTDAANDAAFAGLPASLVTAKANLKQALDWHGRQTADGKLRLKALAAQTFVPTKDEDASCPLCESSLDNEAKKALALELEELKTNSDAAERKISDACLNVQQSIITAVPASIRQWRTIIDQMNPADAYAAIMREKFVLDEPFSNILTGLAASADQTIGSQRDALPNFDYPEFRPVEGEPEAATKLRQEIHSLERLIALVDWWKRARSTFLEAWSALIGKKSDDHTFPAESVESKLSMLEQALGHARPLDDLSKYLTSAATAATAWSEVNKVQKTREAIRDALDALKPLRALVAAETASSIAALSDRINKICERISMNERLTYQEATIGRKEVGVYGSFSSGMRIDAALVANASWLRAILWSFVFALREETLSAIGFNPLPLVVLDDPQATFDPRNKRKWAQELVRNANLAPTDFLGSQLIVTTHERSFYQMMVDHEKFVAQQGLIGGVNKVSGVATVANGGELRRVYDEAKIANDDAKAREYIRKVRIYCEDLIKFMLRGLSNQIPDMTLNELKEELKKLGKAHVAPFDRKPFDALVNALNEGQKAIQYLNDPHHKDDESFGVAQADAVKEYWDKSLLDKIHVAFGVFDTFELYTGEPRTFPWAKNVIEFPAGHKTKVKESEMWQTGIAAAAKTDGRAGDGILTVEEWNEGSKVMLPNHDVFQLAAGTLDPIAGIGDLIIVSNYAKINPRNLVVALFGNTLLARRLNRPENHSEIVVLTGQATDPTVIPEPIIVPPDTDCRKIVGTLFTSHLLPIPAANPEREFIAIPEPSILDRTLKGARLLRVEGRSAEPVAIEGQFLIVRDGPVNAEAISSLDGRLIVGIDEDGARYFKRLRCHDKIAVLESLNPDGLTASEVLSLDGSHSLPRIMGAIEVIGVLFELPGS